MSPGGGVSGEHQWLRLRSLPRGVRVFVQRCAALIARCFDAACVHVDSVCVCVRLFCVLHVGECS